MSGFSTAPCHLPLRAEVGECLPIAPRLRLRSFTRIYTRTHVERKSRAYGASCAFGMGTMRTGLPVVRRSAFASSTAAAIGVAEQKCSLSPCITKSQQSRMRLCGIISRNPALPTRGTGTSTYVRLRVRTNYP